MIRWYALRIDGERYADVHGTPYTVMAPDKSVARFLADLRFGPETQVQSVVEWELCEDERKQTARNIRKYERRMEVMDRLSALVDQERIVSGVNRLDFFAARPAEVREVCWTKGAEYLDDQQARIEQRWMQAAERGEK